MAPYNQVVLINGMPGTMTVVNGRVMGLMDVKVVNGKITEINILADLDRLAELPI
jgi:RNA polymerase sigma-70 factor (ECF subfamily)